MGLFSIPEGLAVSFIAEVSIAVWHLVMGVKGQKLTLADGRIQK